MRKGVAAWPLAAEILIDCRNFMLPALIFSLIHFLKLKFYGNFTYITQIVYSKAQLNPLDGVFSDKPLIIAVIETGQFAEIKESQETWPPFPQTSSPSHSAYKFYFFVNKDNK